MKRAICRSLLCLSASLSANLAQAQSTALVSGSLGGTSGNSYSWYPSISADGRFVAFGSAATDLVPNDTNGKIDIFVRDRLSGVIELVSVDSSGVQANSYSDYTAVSADGRFVAFGSHASNLVAGDTNGYYDIFVRDRLLQTTERVSVSTAGGQGNGTSAWIPAISADGRFVAFQSSATNLVAGYTNTVTEVFLRDRQLGTTERVCFGLGGAQATDESTWPSISSDGRFVAFHSLFAFAGGTTNGYYKVWMRDRQTGTTELVSVGLAGAEANQNCIEASLSADGRFVAFQSNASNLVAGDTNSFADIFVRDRVLGTTARASIDSSGAPGDFVSWHPSLSGDGRYVAYQSAASNLVPGDTNAEMDVFLHDFQTATTVRASVDSAGTQAFSWSERPALSGDGSALAFASNAWNLVGNDSNGALDVFVYERGAPVLDLCQPGGGSVLACPCANPAANAPRGCDNSSATGGARLLSSGIASLAGDTLVFTTNGEKPTATSVVLQGDVEVPNGLAFGQGVRCVGGGLKRLYVKTASGGSIQAPGAGDASVSARSAALGDPIVAGTNRWYAVYYRDPVVLGGCAAASTFNITQTQRWTWSP